MEILDRLPGLPVEERVFALERLVRNPSPGIRERALRIGSALLSDDQLITYLRNDGDAALRNAGLEILKLRGSRSFSAALRLLKDADADVVLQAVLILEHLRDPRALESLRGVLDHPDPNVIQAAILATGKLGNTRSIPDLLPMLKGDPWLQMATVQALGDLRSTAAIRPLSELLTDLLVGSMAAEAIARIGGPVAFRVLSSHWLMYGEQLEAESQLGLMAHVLEGLPRRPASPPGLAETLVRHLQDPALEARVAAARCLLVLGPSDHDATAIATLTCTDLYQGVLPAALLGRQDLIGLLLRQSSQAGPPRLWGLLLAARHPEAVPLPEFFAATRESAEEPEALPPLIQALGRIEHPDLASHLLHLYLQLSPEGRSALEPVLLAHAAGLRGELERDASVPPVDRLVLSAILGDPVDTVIHSLLALDAPSRVTAIPQLSDQRDVVRRLPWEKWLNEEPEIYTDVAAEVACQAELRELLPVLRQRAAAKPTPTLLRSFGELRDRDSVPLLIGLLAGGSELGPLVLESLGRIGGPEARAALTAAAREASPGEARIAYRALSLCATEDDSGLFREAVGHADWYVRLACADVLSRFVLPENLGPLARLAGDPVPAVAHRALSFLAG